MKASPTIVMPPHHVFIIAVVVILNVVEPIQTTKKDAYRGEDQDDEQAQDSSKQGLVGVVRMRVKPRPPPAPAAVAIVVHVPRGTTCGWIVSVEEGGGVQRSSS